MGKKKNRLDMNFTPPYSVCSVVSKIYL